MKSLNNLLLLLAVLLTLGACEKDGEKFYLSTPEENELRASTGHIVLTAANANLYALSLAWTEQTVQLSDERYQPTTGVTTTLQASLTEDFSGKCVESSVNGLSMSYTVSSLNVIAYQLEATPGVATPVYFRLAASNGSNIPAVYSNVVEVSVTAYEIDMRFADILDASLTDTGKDFYSANADGNYIGFYGATAWEGMFVREADGTVWHTAQSNGTGTPFLLTTNAAEGTWNLWFPDQAGCYFVNVNTTQKLWTALLMPTLTASSPDGDIALTYSRSANQWTGTFNGTAGTSLDLQIRGTGKFYDNTTVSGTDNTIDSEKAEDRPFAFGGSAGQLTFTTGESAAASNIAVSVPATGECTLVIDLNNPQAWTATVTEGGSTAPAYPDYLEMQGAGDLSEKGWLATLNPVYVDGENQGTYQGIYQMTQGWDNFKIVDQTAGIWYGSDPSDLYQLSAADGNYNIWFDQGECRSFVVTANLANLTWSPTEITQINVCGGFNNWDTAKDLMTYNESTRQWTATCDITSTEYGFYFLLNSNWDWALKGDTDGLYLAASAGDGSYVPAETGTYKITLDLETLTFSMEKQE